MNKCYGPNDKPMVLDRKLVSFNRNFIVPFMVVLNDRNISTHRQLRCAKNTISNIHYSYGFKSRLGHHCHIHRIRNCQPTLHMHTTKSGHQTTTTTTTKNNKKKKKKKTRHKRICTLNTHRACKSKNRWNLLSPSRPGGICNCKHKQVGSSIPIRNR